MKKLTLILAVSSMMYTAIAAAASDSPSILAISGTVKNSASSCTVNLGNMTVVNLPAQDASALPLEGNPHSNVTSLPVVSGQIEGDHCSGVGIKITGNTAGEGLSLANTAQGSTAATGVGVGVYDGMGGEVIIPNITVKPTLEGALLFRVGMVKLKDQAPGAGSVQSSLTVQIERL